MFDIEPGEFRRETLRLFTSGIRGLNITLPHKQAAAELVNELTPRAARAQAVNTIAFYEDTTLLGDNTDGIGLAADLEQNLGLDLSNMRILILGAGGAVRGILGTLMERRVDNIVIANRTPARALRLAAEFGDLGSIEGCGFADVEGPPFDLVINGTAASLQGRDAGNAAGPRRRGHRVLRHGLRPRSNAVYAVGEYPARPARDQGLGHARRTGGGFVRAVARRQTGYPGRARGFGAVRVTRNGCANGTAALAFRIAVMFLDRSVMARAVE